MFIKLNCYLTSGRLRFFYPAAPPRNSANFGSSGRSTNRFFAGSSSLLVSRRSASLLFIQLRLPETRQTSVPPSEAQTASLSDPPVCSFLDSRLRFYFILLRLPETRQTSVPPSEAQTASLSDPPVCSFLDGRLRFYFIQLRLPETRQTSVPPSKAQTASLSDPPVCSFLDGRLRFYLSNWHLRKAVVFCFSIIY